MVDALKRVVVPELRQRRFSGTFPHLRRITSTHIDLVTFQFDKWGGGFVIEIARCAPEGFITTWGRQISPNKVRAWDLHPNDRLRLMPGTGSGRDSWFRFDSGRFDTVAQSVLPFLEQAEQWYASKVPVRGQKRG